MHLDPQRVSLVDAGQTITIDGAGDFHVIEGIQRNWSRVAVATKGGERFFLKQFVDRVGRSHRRGFDGDQQTIDELGSEVLPGLHVVPVVGRREDLLVTVSPFIEMTTIDSITRGRARHRFEAARVGEALVEILTTRTVEGRPDDVAVWKGLDPKNIGWTDDGTLWVFDFGPPKVIPRERAASRVLAAGLLSRWVARPGFHLVSPERSILRGVCEPLVPFTTLESVERELRQNQELRMREPQRTGAAAAATRFGLATVGRLHWSALEREARRLFADR